MELTREKERLVKEPCDTCIYEEGSRYCIEYCPYEAKIEQEPCEVAQMSLDDAIKHAEEVADREEKKIVPKEDYQNMPWIDESNSSCLKCSQEHRQLAEWLKELKTYKEQEPCNDIAKERYKDLCEYFGETKDILESRKEFKAWLERVKWHIHKAEELYEKYEYKQEPCDNARADQRFCETTTNNDEPIYINYPIITCNDAISREEVLKPYKDLKDDDVISVWLIRKNIEQQKSVQPSRKVIEDIKAEIQEYSLLTRERVIGIIDRHTKGDTDADTN